jgi:oligopeptide/dipeptide ABC transporter ATP-binding protein
MIPALNISGLRIEAADGSALVEAADLAVAPGEKVALVGESGSGKSLTVMSAAGLLSPGLRIAAGVIAVAGEDVRALDAEGLRRLRGGKVGIVFQDPFASFNPVRRVGAVMVDALTRRGTPRAAAKARVIARLGEVGLPDPERLAAAFPHELSGGQRQRAMIALALLSDPALVIADEPTTALDPTIQLQVMAMLLQRTKSAGLVVVTHDLSLARSFADRVVVMYAGRVVEAGAAAAVFAAPNHPYTAALLAAAPRLGERGLRAPIPGAPPSPKERPAGCPFAPRCPAAGPDCALRPPLAERDGRSFACWRPLTVAAA